MTEKCPVYAMYKRDEDIIRRSDSVWAYRLLTMHYFYRKRSNGKYETREHNPETLLTNFINAADCYQYDDNHPWKLLSVVADLEINEVYKVSDPKWHELCADYIRMLRMIGASGHQVNLYGIDSPAEFNIEWNIGRYKWRCEHEPSDYNRMKLEEFELKRAEMELKWMLLGSKFAEYIDAPCLSFYTPYDIPENTWHISAWKHYVSAKAERAFINYTKPVYAFMSPVVTDGGEIPLPIWEEMVHHLRTCEWIDRLYIFRKSSDVPVDGWKDCLVN